MFSISPSHNTINGKVQLKNVFLEEYLCKSFTEQPFMVKINVVIPILYIFFKSVCQL